MHFVSYQNTSDANVIFFLRFAVFGLGSTAYPNFCAFAKYIDRLMGVLGGERLCEVALGDELCGQEKTFQTWARQVFKVLCCKQKPFSCSNLRVIMFSYNNHHANVFHGMYL